MIPRMLIAAALATALISMAPRQARAGACARSGLYAQVITHGGDQVPAGAGVLISWGGDGGHEEELDDLDLGEEVALRPKWRFLVGKRKSKPKVVVIAPGLAVYRPGKLTGKVALVDGKGKKVVSLKVSKKKRAFTAAAPDVKSMVVSSASSSSPRSGSSTWTSVDLTAEAPADAVALVVYEISGTTQQAISWNNIRGGKGTQFGVYSSPGRCSPNPPGLTSPSPGGKYRLAWIDQFGRSSPMSNETTATAAPSTGVTPGGDL